MLVDSDFPKAQLGISTFFALFSYKMQEKYLWRAMLTGTSNFSLLDSGDLGFAIISLVKIGRAHV